MEGNNENLIRLYFAGREHSLFSPNINKCKHSRLVDLVITYADMVLTQLKEMLTDYPVKPGIIHEVYNRKIDFQLMENFILPLTQFDSSGWSGAQGQVLSKNYLEKASFKPLYCQPNLTCPPGHHKQYGVVNITQDADEEHSFRCDLCPLNTIKIGFGDGPCVPCVGEFNIDNGERTACVDPFTDIKMYFNHEQRYMTITFASIGALADATILILFVIKCETPIVRSSDKVLSLLHLTSLLCVFLAVNGNLHRKKPHLQRHLHVSRGLLLYKITEVGHCFFLEESTKCRYYPQDFTLSVIHDYHLGHLLKWQLIYFLHTNRTEDNLSTG